MNLAPTIGTIIFVNAGNLLALGNVHKLNYLLLISLPDMPPSDNDNLQRAYHRNII